MDYEETSGNNLLISDSNYTINSDDKSFNLKTIKIRKAPIKYSFIGGMWYSKETFSFCSTGKAKKSRATSKTEASNCCGTW